jgi:hypothetical protein
VPFAVRASLNPWEGPSQEITRRYRPILADPREPAHLALNSANPARLGFIASIHGVPPSLRFSFASRWSIEVGPPTVFPLLPVADAFTVSPLF